MKVEFRASKSGSKTCSLNNFPLHSNYDPKNEALKFSNTIDCDFNPKNIIITGPCLPYLPSILKKKFPHSKIIAIQFCKDFEQFNSSWDKVFLVTSNTNPLEFQEELYNYFGEEGLFTSIFLSWKPSEKPFENEHKITWEGIKQAYEKSKSIIGTISFFNKTWFFNTIKFFKYIKKTFSINQINKDVLITASGPSLKNQIDFIKCNIDNFFILALSSSVTVLLENKIIPDAILSTDGGYYAQRHLKILETQNKYQNIPIIIPPEAKVSTYIIENNPIIPLIYGDSIDSKILEMIKIKFLKGKRNGTVSGTAAELALSLTKNNIYFTGLDLAVSKGHSHTQNNVLEIDNSLNDYKINSTENRIVPSTFSNKSLEIYRNWFSTRDKSFYNKIFRLVSKNENLEQIPNLTDILNSDIKIKNNDSNTFFNENVFYNYKEIVLKFIKEQKNKILNDESDIFEWFKIVGYTDYIQYIRCKEEDKKNIYIKLKENVLILIEEVIAFIIK